MCRVSFDVWIRRGAAGSALADAIPVGYWGPRAIVPGDFLVGGSISETVDLANPTAGVYQIKTEILDNLIANEGDYFLQVQAIYSNGGRSELVSSAALSIDNTP